MSEMHRQSSCHKETHSTNYRYTYCQALTYRGGTHRSDRGCASSFRENRPKGKKKDAGYPNYPQMCHV